MQYNSFNNLAEQIYNNNIKAGWWKSDENGEIIPREPGVLLCLIHSEVSEAMEGFRKNLMDDHLPHRKMAEVELADTIIRILDMCGHYKFDIDGAIQEKLEYNKSRKDHQLENRLKEGGKTF